MGTQKAGMLIFDRQYLVKFYLHSATAVIYFFEFSCREVRKIMLQSRVATAQELARTQLSHTVYVPEGAASSRPPVVVLVHGRSGDSRAMWVFSKALEETKPLVVAPQAPYQDPLGGYTWWPIPVTPESDSS